MKKKLIIIAVLVIALVTSYIFCGTDKNDTGIDSIKIEEYTAALSNKIDLDSIAGTYCGVLPPNVKTTLTLNPNRSLENFAFFLSMNRIEKAYCVSIQMLLRWYNLL